MVYVQLSYTAYIGQLLALLQSTQDEGETAQQAVAFCYTT